MSSGSLLPHNDSPPTAVDGGGGGASTTNNTPNTIEDNARPTVQEANNGQAQPPREDVVSTYTH